MKLYRYYLLERNIRGYALARNFKELGKLLTEKHTHVDEKDLAIREVAMDKPRIIDWQKIDGE